MVILLYEKSMPLTTRQPLVLGRVPCTSRASGFFWLKQQTTAPLPSPGPVNGWTVPGEGFCETRPGPRESNGLACFLLGEFFHTVPLAGLAALSNVWPENIMEPFALRPNYRPIMANPGGNPELPCCGGIQER